ncbi:MAG: hypothetical protein GXP41_11605, partial [Chloroflexi bacterium]|nr:hypothetical protein [Chloroflexota bacterium]
MGPLQDGANVAIIGGGPGGTACAISLLHQAKDLGRRIKVAIYEGKVFANNMHHNQCSGVVSPPIIDILESQLNIPFPFHLVQRKITGYVLHGNRRALILDGLEDQPSYAMRR